MQLLSKLDTLVQRGVDAFVFLLMRTFGWKKSFIRYAAMATFIATFAGFVFLEHSFASPLSRACVAFLPIMILVFLLVQWLGYKADLRAESRPGAASSTDRPYPIDKFMKLAGPLSLVKVTSQYWLIPKVWVEKSVPQTTCHAMTTLEILFILSYLFWTYIKRTPYNPPPAEEKVQNLVPAPTST